MSTTLAFALDNFDNDEPDTVFGHPGRVDDGQSAIAQSMGLGEIVNLAGSTGITRPLVRET